VTTRSRAAGIDPRLDCDHHDVRHGHASVPTRATTVFERERAIWLYRVRPISTPSVAALVVVVPPEPLAAYLD
jgi:hypothetical protein